MNFYTQQHKHYCGIDLHANAMYVCILDAQGTKLVHKNLPTTLDAAIPGRGREGYGKGDRRRPRSFAEGNCTDLHGVEVPATTWRGARDGARQECGQTGTHGQAEGPARGRWSTASEDFYI
jgi:hypothetical protein